MENASLRLFSDPRLERLTHTRPETVATLWSAVIGGLFGWAAADDDFRFLPALWFAAVGGLAWTLFEYALHRWLFHWRPKAAPLRRLVFLLHGVHHAEPADQSRVVMPLAVSAPLALALWAVPALTLPTPWSQAFFGGFLTGYLVYDMTHAACHQTGPASRWLRTLRCHHLRHHHADEHSNFGVSSPLWDHVFGTGLERDDIRSARRPNV